MRDSLLHDSGLGAAATISDGMAGRAAPGGRRARRACTGICLHACLLRAAARGGLPGMHWDLPACLAAWLLIVPPIDLTWPRGRRAAAAARRRRRGARWRRRRSDPTVISQARV